MKKILLSFFVLAFSAGVFAQQKAQSCCSQDYTMEELRAFMLDENRPQFPGGDSALTEFLKENTLYPRAYLHFHPSWTITLKFCVEKDGSISDVKILDGGGMLELFDKEAIRVVQAMPKWKPATTQSGEPICAPFILRIRFRVFSGMKVSDK